MSRVNWYSMFEKSREVFLRLTEEDKGKIDYLKYPIRWPEGCAVRIIRGNLCRDSTALFSEFAGVLQFPTYFGYNWDAYEECLSECCEWFDCSGLILTVQNAETTLQDDDDRQWEIFCDLLVACDRQIREETVCGRETSQNVNSGLRVLFTYNDLHSISRARRTFFDALPVVTGIPYDVT